MWITEYGIYEINLLFEHFRRKDLPLKNCKIDVLLITGMLSPYAGVVEKLHQHCDKEKCTLLKIERAGDVLADAVSILQIIFGVIYSISVRSLICFSIIFENFQFNLQTT